MEEFQALGTPDAPTDHSTVNRVTVTSDLPFVSASAWIEACRVADPGVEK